LAAPDQQISLTNIEALLPSNIGKEQPILR
jgi:hypothetical protein